MPEPGSTQRRVVCVVGTEPAGVAPSGADTVAATLAALGAGAVPADWVADLHAELLDRSGVEVDDARPTAWFETGRVSANGITRARLTEWLGRQFVHPAGERAGEPRPEVVLSDPGLPWLLGLWRAAALRCDAEVAHVVVLRAVDEVAADAGGVAAWLNRALHVERATRSTPRSFLPYAAVVEDWTIPFVGLGRDLGLPSVREATANQIRRGHEVVAAGLAEPSAGLPAGRPPSPADGVPPPLLDLAAATWEALTTTGGPDPAELDRLRAAYLELYAAAESITGSSLRAARAASAAAPAPGAASLVGRVRGRIRAHRVAR